jgi:hypothetical protein
MSKLTYKFGTSLDTSTAATGVAGSTQGNGMTQAQVNAYYTSVNSLFGLVTSLGNGWQKFIVPKTGRYHIRIVGAAGGHNGTGSINSTTGATSGNYHRGGRGADLEGDIKLYIGDILYIAVGQRGWCNTWVDYGGGGGGCSVIMRVKSTGTFTFTPTGEKCECLFVAGGGGGAGDDGISLANSNNYANIDAKTANGANTNAGSTSACSGGAGLTAGSASGSIPGTSSILSGTSRSSGRPYGGFPQSGAGWNGGGGGSGYSGGSAADSRSGDGGTSYINPSYVSNEIRKLYFDSVMTYRNNGFVEISQIRNSSKYILIKDDEGTKYFDTDKTWKLIDTNDPFRELSLNDYVNYGYVEDIDNINNINSINGNVKFLVASDNVDETLLIDGLSINQIIKSNFEMNLSAFEKINKITIAGTFTGVNIKVAVSNDHGITYKTLDSGVWIPINIDDKSEFSSNGIPLTEFNAIPSITWKNLGGSNIRFAFIVNQTSSGAGTTSSIISNLTLNVDMLGMWEAAQNKVDYTYGYPASDKLKVKILTSGDYKINYLDSISNE